jgi:hypothetical protein
LCSSAFRLQAQLREHYRIHYDSNNVLRIVETPDQKPEMSDLMDDQQQRREQEMQFVQHFEMIKNEKNETELLETDMYQDSPAKKPKLDQ